MVREDLVAGLRNALERGASLEGAKQTLLNAGYSSEEVEEASNYLSAGSVLAVQPQQLKKPADSVQPSKSKQPPAPHPQQPALNQQQQAAKPEKAKGQGFFGRNWKIILLLGVLVVLIILFVLVLLFRETIATWLW